MVCLVRVLTCAEKTVIVMGTTNAVPTDVGYLASNQVSIHCEVTPIFMDDNKSWSILKIVTGPCLGSESVV